MQSIPGLKPTGPEAKLQELFAPATMVGPGGGQKRNRTFPIPAPTLAPKMIRQSDMRDHTMKVLGKQDPNFIITSKPSGPPGTDAITPNFGNITELILQQRMGEAYATYGMADVSTVFGVVSR